jgi:protein O-GlcNAc transferase
MRRAWPLHEAGNIAEAQRLYHEILRLRPDYADAHYLLGRIEQDAGRDAEAIPHMRNALRANDKEPHFHRSLGQAFYALGAWDEAIVYFHNAVGLEPADFESWTNLGCAYQKLGRLAEATRHFEKAVEIQQDSPQALNNVAMALKDRGRVDDALAAFRKALKLAPDFKDLFSNYLYALNFSTRVTPAEVFEAHAGYDAVFGSGAHGVAAPAAADRDPERRLRIAYFSPDLRSHPVSVFIEPVLAHHDRARVEVFCYHLFPFGDVVTARLKPLADHWVETRSLGDEQIAERLRADRIDIVVDLAGHTGENRLPVLGRRPAPVIATWLGYPNTTGLKAVDWRITDAACDPPGVERYHTEQVYRLPGAQWCFTRPDAHRDVHAEVTPLPAAGDGLLRFGSFNNASKLNDEMVRTWAEILRRIERSTLLVWGVGDEQSAHIREVVREAGVDPARLEFSDRTGFPAQLAMYQRTDIALDTFPYSGVTTTFNSLWMGVPMLSLVGEVSASRSTLSILRALGLEDWTATTREALVETAVRKAADLPALAALRAALRARLEASPLMDGPAFARKLEEAYRSMCRGYCAGGAR